MHLLLVINGLGPGGAERVCLTLAEGWLARGYAVTLLTFDDPDSESFYPIDPEVRRVRLGFHARNQSMLGKLTRVARIIGGIRKAALRDRTDIAIGFMDQESVLSSVALFGTRIPVVAYEQVSPGGASLVDPHSAPLQRKLLGMLRATVYAATRRIVLFSSRGIVGFPKFLRGRIRTVPNPIHIFPPGTADLELSAPFLLGVGRLVKQKRFDLLLDAFAQITHEFPDLRLAIVGEGPLRADLVAQANELRISDKVVFPGLTRNPFALYAKAEALVLCSDFEGFGNVLVEAMGSGCPVIATDCDFGPREVLADGEYGVLVPVGDSRALAGGIVRMLSDTNHRAELVRCGVERARAFSPEAALKAWDEVFAELGSG